ncbi:MAG: hypothetical protein KIG94_10550 [Acetatifactor sp.]|nr:hypothetical protein [Acetatifactor sp.]
MEENQVLARALKTLEQFVLELSEQAGCGEDYGRKVWEGIRSSSGLLQELAYYHDYGRFLGKYRVAGYTLPDIIVWQVDHFKLYMDRVEMNRYHQERLLLQAFETLTLMEQDPTPFIEKMRGETGQDIPNA